MEQERKETDNQGYLFPPAAPARTPPNPVLQKRGIRQGVQTQVITDVRCGGGMYFGEDDTFQAIHPYQGGERQGILHREGAYPFRHRDDRKGTRTPTTA